ncbi:MAG: YkgJ family cysteine cluster protein [Salibacteraceae bacterium]
MLDSYKNDIEWSISNQKRIASLKKRMQKERRIDHIINGLHEDVFDEIDCLKCGNCCKTTGPLFNSMDIKRLSKVLKMPEKEFVREYLRLDEDHDFVFKTMPCPFLGEDNYCQVYESRPRACRQFPHTDERGQLNIYHLTRKNAKICPAVSKIIQQLDKML